MRATLRRYLKALGPGLITGAADDDPSGITTYSIVGAAFGFDLLWTAAASTPLMIAVQLVCARIGLVTGQGVIGAARGLCPVWTLVGACGLLLVANGLNIGADLAGMAEVTEMLTGLPHAFLIPVYGLLILWALLFTSYRRFARWLKWLTLSLVAYVFAALLARPH
jgi:Mn2+/Fe2+ NRAMP family transporter